LRSARAETGFVARSLLLAGLLSAACGGLVAAAPAKGYRVEPLKEAAPAEVAEPVRKALAAEGLRVLDPKGEPLADVWLRSAVPTVEMPKAELNVKLGKVEEGALLGVIRFHKKSSDFKGNGFPAGVFTMRRGIQPVDGDHQGATETRDFALLAPAKVDSSTASVTTKEAVKLSVQVAGSKHPTVLWLVRVVEEDAKLPRMVEDETLVTWALECELPVAGKEAKPLRVGLVLVGKAAEH